MDVRGCRCLARSASGGSGSRIINVARGGVSRPGQGTQLPCPLPPAREGPDALDCLAKTVSQGALASNSGSTREAQSAAHSPISRWSSSLTPFTRTYCRFSCSLSLSATPLTGPARPGTATRAQLWSRSLGPQAVGASTRDCFSGPLGSR